MLQDYAVDYGTVTLVCAPNHDLAPAPTLAQIKQLQDAIGAKLESGELAPLDATVEHLFSPGQYTRICRIPAGSFVVGKMHRHQHPTMLTKGSCRINTDKGMETIHAPHVWISQIDAKRGLYTFTDCEFVTVHLNPDDTQDLDAIEAAVIVPEALIQHQPQQSIADFIQEVYA